MGFKTLLSITKNFGFARRFSSYIQKLKEEAQRIEKHSGATGQLVSQYNLLGNAYKEEKNYLASIDYYKRALFIAEENLGGNKYELSLGYNNIAEIYKLQGDLESSVNYLEKSLKLQCQVLEPQDFRIGLTYNNLATLYGDLGNYEKASEYLEQARPIMEIHLNDPVSGTYFLNLSTLSRRSGKPKETFEYLDKAITIYQNIGHIEDLAHATMSKGLAKWSFGSTQEAKALMQEAIQTKQAKDEVLAQWHNKLGTLLNNLGFIEEALENFKSAIELSKGSKDPETWMYFHNIGNAYRSLKDDLKAQLNLERANGLAVQNYGEVSQEGAITFENLASLFQSQNQFNKALEYAQKTLDIQKQLASSTAASHNRIGIINHQLGNYTKAKEHLLDAKNSLEPSELLANVLNSLSLVYSELNEPENASETLQSAIEITKQVKGENSLSLAEPYANLAFMNLELHRYDRAIGFHAKALEVCESNLGEDLRTATYSDYLGDSFRLVEDYPRAIECHMKAMEIRLKNNNKFLIGASYHNLAFDYKYQNQFEEALELHQKGHQYYQESLGSDHHFLAGSHVLIAEALELKNQLAEAKHHLEKALEIFNKNPNNSQAVQEVKQKLQKYN